MKGKGGTESSNANVHQLVINYGRDQAREMVEHSARGAVDVAAEVMADTVRRIGFSYSGFCLTALPHKKLSSDSEIWVRHGHRITLEVQPGRMVLPDGSIRHFGVPYGARARMILLYLQSEAIRTGTREVEIGHSMREWMQRMGISVGGESVNALREQAQRIAECNLRFTWEDDQRQGHQRGGILRSGEQFRGRKRDSGLPWDDVVVLDELFYADLVRHPVPMPETAIRELCDRSMSLDIFLWLSYRLHALERPTEVGWTALYDQFGTGFKEQRQFRRRFVPAIGVAIAAYPGARVQIHGAGVTLEPSPPPVAKRVP